MESIRFTNDKNEMVEIAKRIVAEKGEKYPETVFNKILDTVKAYMPQATKKEIEDTVWITIYYYWYFGCTVDEYFYYRLASKSFDEIKTYMLAHERVLYINHLNRREDAHILNNKYETYQLLKEYYLRDMIIISSKDDYLSFLEFVKKHKEFVVKPTDMGCGHGVHKESIIDMSENEVLCLFERLLSESSTNKEKYNRGKESSVIIEEIIQQVDELANVHPASVNGIRVPTVRIDGKIHVYQPWWKIGRGGQFVTSAVYGTMDAGIDAVTGIVDTVGITEKLEQWEYHPDTNFKILGYKIPKWDELIETVKAMAEKLPTISYVGWDMVLTPKGWCVMEGNFTGDFMWQLYRGRGMKKEFEDLIGWKMDKKFWWQA